MGKGVEEKTGSHSRGDSLAPSRLPCCTGSTSCAPGPRCDFARVFQVSGQKPHRLLELGPAPLAFLSYSVFLPFFSYYFHSPPTRLIPVSFVDIRSFQGFLCPVSYSLPSRAPSLGTIPVSVLPQPAAGITPHSPFLPRPWRSVRIQGWPSPSGCPTSTASSWRGSWTSPASSTSPCATR